ncbi:MAG: TIGR00701 family protein [Candidatus Marinimicrobia bacterium]|nr:TIGR00701 family protein [Candidatus Neomarinimicrobiota bacterium]|tara:strand:+ start:676 stop:1104 length:429 start_codon:yes stop_codon:yes gene_type:complete
MGNVYQWVKIFHVMFVVAWMAGLLYLPRIFVYHSMDDTTDETSNVFKLMEKRLFYFIMYPSALIVWITGIYMAYALGLYGWLVLKFFFVIVLTLYHINLGRYLKDFKNDNNRIKTRFFRIINEVPFLIMFIILILVIIKPDF